MSSSLRYRPEIDGLRCIAVLAVIAFHVKESLLPGGYLGVDVFFVISGYLITLIIIEETRNETFSLTRFWDRRIKRILPAAAVVLLAVSVFQSELIFRPDLQQISNQKFACLLSFANIYFWKNASDYWGNSANESPFLHYWSLSVEEQYYILYPLILVAIIRKAKPHIKSIFMLMIFTSFAFFAYGAVNHPSAAFYLLPTRMWQLGAGCLLAVASNSTPIATNSLGAFAGISLIGFSFLLPVTTSGVGYEALAAVAGACLIIGSGSNRISAIVLQNRLTVFIGRISYSLYLWHWPIIVSLKKIREYGNVTSNVALGALGTGLLIVLSALSFYLVEEPFRKMRYGTPIALGFAVAIGFYFIAVEPHIINRPYLSDYDTPSWHGRYYDLMPREGFPASFEIIAKSVHTPEREASAVAFKQGGIIRQRKTTNPRVVLFGDSHAVTWSKVVDEVTEELGLTTSLWAMNGESPMFYIPPVYQPFGRLSNNERLEYDSQRIFFIKKWKPDIVIVACRWDKVHESSTSEFFQFLESNSKHVLLIESPPVLDGLGNRSLFQYLSFLGMKPSSSLSENQVWDRVRFGNAVSARNRVVNFVTERSNFSFLPTADLFAEDRGAIVASGRKIFYLDDDHLTDEGSNLAKDRIRKSIQNILNGDLNQFPIVSQQGEESNKTLHTTALPHSE